MKEIISNIPPQTIINVILALAYVYLLYRVISDRHVIFALARHTFVDAIRKKVLYVSVIFAIILIMWSAASHSPFPGEKVKWVESQSIRMSSFFSMIALIFLAATSLPKDISDKTIYSIVTKPVRRSYILLGRILGFVSIAAVMIVIMGTISYCFVRLTAEKASQKTGERETLLLTAKKTILPTLLTIEGPGVERRRGLTWIYEKGIGALWRIRGLEEFKNVNTARPVLLIQLPVRSKNGGDTINAKLDFLDFQGYVIKKGNRPLTITKELKNNVPTQIQLLDVQAILGSQGAPSTLGVNIGTERDVFVKISVINNGDSFGLKPGGVWIEAKQVVPPGEEGAGGLRTVKLASEKPRLITDEVSPRGQQTWFSWKSKYRPTWHFSGLRYLVENITTDKISCQAKIRVSSEKLIEKLETIITVNPGLENESKQNETVSIDEKRIGTLNFQIDKNLVNENGDVALAIHTKKKDVWIGAAKNQLLISDIPGNFEFNFFKAFLIIFFQLVLIISVSIMASTFLSAPVSILLAVFFYFCGHVVDFMENVGRFIESSGHGGAHGGISNDSIDILVYKSRAVLEGILSNFAKILPDFREFSVTDYIVSNTHISLQTVGASCAYMALYVMIAFIIAYLIFSVKEIQ